MTRHRRHAHVGHILALLVCPPVLAASCGQGNIGGLHDDAAQADHAARDGGWQWDGRRSLGDSGTGRPDAGAPPDAHPAPMDASAATDAWAPLPDGAPPPDGAVDPVTRVCTRWSEDRQDLREGAWTGDVSTCDAGDVMPPGRDNALRLVNLYRWLAGLPQATLDSVRNSKAQQCALMMHANHSLSHNPPSSWSCYSQDGAQAAGSSNIATAPCVEAVDMYMSDFGNEDTMGHRRWILSNSLGAIGIGSTSSYSCMWVVATGGHAAAAWTAWPPAGIVPFELFRIQSLDDIGWTVQSDSIDLSSAQVTVTLGGRTLPVTVSNLPSGYGSWYAVRIVPQSWNTQAGNTYHVSITNVSTPIDYDVQVVDCP